jgi:hypothetical protein
MAFKLPFSLPKFDRRGQASPETGEIPRENRRSQGKLPLIGNFDIETQFRILGTVFLISLLIAIAAIFMQNQATSRGITYLSVAGQIGPLTQQIPKAALSAMQGQKEGFTELRDARDNFGNLLERLVEGGEIRGIKVSATSLQARPALDALREAWSKQNDIINLILAQENRFTAIGNLARESLLRGQAMADAASTGSAKLPYLTERILRASTQLASSSGFDEAMAAQLAKDIAAAQELVPAESTLGKSLSAMQPAVASLSGDLKPLVKARSASASLQSGWQRIPRI